VVGPREGDSVRDEHGVHPADSAGAWQIGTPPLLAAAPLEGSVETLREAGIDRLREKSLALTDFLIALVDDRLPEVAVGTPANMWPVAATSPSNTPTRSDWAGAHRPRRGGRLSAAERSPSVSGRVVHRLRRRAGRHRRIEAILDAGAHKAYATSEGGVT